MRLQNSNFHLESKVFNNIVFENFLALLRKKYWAEFFRGRFDLVLFLEGIYFCEEGYCFTLIFHSHIFW